MTFAFIFSDVGFGEWLVLLAVILVVVGPKRLPHAARTFGSYYGKFRRAADAFKRQLMDMDTAFDRAVTEAERDVDRSLAVEEELPDYTKPPEATEPVTPDVPHQES